MATLEREPADGFAFGDQMSGMASQAAGEWGQFLADPAGRAALISFGLSMMQPIAPGQSAAGQFGQSVGLAGEAVSGIAEQDRKERESESKADLRGAQAENYVARKETAATKADLAAERFQHQKSRARADDKNKRTTALLTAQSRYNTAVNLILEQNKNGPFDVGRGYVPKPIPTFGEWLKQNPELESALAPSDAGGDDEATSDVSTSGRSQPAAAGGAPARKPMAQEGDFIKGPDGTRYKVLSGGLLEGPGGKQFRVKNGKLEPV